MGSFAYSLHVKTTDAAAVSNSIRQILLDAGYAATDEEPDTEALWGMSSDLRAVRVSAAHHGWCGVLDSDMAGSLALGAELSSRLHAFAIGFMVNDSDSWHYQLFHDGSQLDEFDSSGGADGAGEFGELAPGVAQMLSAGGLGAMQAQIQEGMRDLQQRMESEMPPEIRELLQNLQRGAASADDMRRYAEWVQGQSQRLSGAVNEILAGVLPTLGQSAVPQADLEHHLQRLRPILPADVSDARVLEVLGKQAVFAEEILTEFLELLGIQPFFANLSYRYLGECAGPELLEADIKLMFHLKFKTGS